IDSRRRGTCLCPRLDSTPHRGGRRDSVRSCPSRQAWAAWRGVVRPQPPTRHLSRAEATTKEARPRPALAIFPPAPPLLHRPHPPAAQVTTSAQGIQKPAQLQTIAIASAV